jgi:hypothetical protein
VHYHDRFEHKPQSIAIALVSVCRQTRTEALALFNSLNTFRFYKLFAICKFAQMVSQQGLANTITTISIFAITATNWHEDAGTENTDATCLRLFPLLKTVHIFIARFLSPVEQILIGLTLREVTGRIALEVIFEG